jgi:hypothetical protein
MHAASVRFIFSGRIHHYYGSFAGGNGCIQFDGALRRRRQLRGKRFKRNQHDGAQAE